MDSDKQFQEDLTYFGFSSCKDSELNRKEVTVRYYKLAKLNHPDKAGGSDKAFQNILDVYRRITDYLDKKDKSNNSGDVHPEKNFFMKNNFPKQKMSSTLVILQNEYSKQWQHVLSDVFGEGSPIANGVDGRIFKSGKLTITLYVKPKSDGKTKLHIQGLNVDSQLDFIFTEMPSIYKKVCQMADEKSLESRDCDNCDFNSSKIGVLMEHIQKKHILSEKEKAKLFYKSNINQTFTCEVCDFKADKIGKVKLHMRKHNKQSGRNKVKKYETLKTIDVIETVSIDYKIDADTEALLQEDTSITDSIDKEKDTITITAEKADSARTDVIEEVASKTNTKSESENVQMVGLYSCNKCDYDTENSRELEVHNVQNVHSIKNKSFNIIENDEEEGIPEESFICGQCSKCFESLTQCEEHIIAHNHKCYKCEFETKDSSELKRHEVQEHKFLKCKKESHKGKCKNIPVEAKTIKCDQCSKTFDDSNLINTHACSISCDQCEFIARDVSGMVEHIRLIHSQPLNCNFCDFEAESRVQLAEHTLHYHEDRTVLNTLADQVDDVKKSFELFETFKVEMENAMKAIIQNQNSLKQELFVIRNNQIKDSKITKIESMIGSLSTAMNDIVCKSASSQKENPPSPTPYEGPSRASTPEPPARTPTSPPTRPSVPQPTRSLPSVVTRQEEEFSKILLVGDSISSNLDITALEKATQSKLVTAKAYSSVHDTVSNNAKQAARFPASNFTDVIPAQLSKGKYKSLIIQSGSVDITNFNTKGNPSQFLEYFKQETVLSARNLFTSAENALSAQPSLNTVVIMKQIPRYDPPKVDPLCLKPALSQLYNNTITELWMNSPLKNRIVIGNHNIECTGAIKEARYRETKSGRFDGIHLYGSSGRKTYTLSVLNILKAAQLTSSEFDYHQSCAQYKYQTRQMRYQHGQNNVCKQTQDTDIRPVYRQQRGYTVPITNRFNTLSNLNQGNW